MPARSGIGVLTTDRDLVVRTWNPWLSAATGKPEDRACGRALAELVGDAARWDRAVFEEILETGTARVFAPAFHRYLIPCPPHRPSPHFDCMQQRVTIAPLREADAIVGLIVTIEDVTERLEAEHALASQMRARGDGEVALAAVGADDWRLRRTAVQALRRTATAEDVAHLLHTLQREHHNLNILSSALQVLVAADLDVVPPLIVLLRDPDANLRMHAALALGELRADTAVPALLAALDDADVNVRFHAIEALGRIRACDAVDRLAGIAASGDFFLSFAAIDALAAIDDPRVTSRLAALLTHATLRDAVVDALGTLGDEESVAPLVVLLNENAGDAAAIANALAGIHSRYEESGAGAYIEDLVGGTIARSGVEALTQALQRSRSHGPAIVGVLGWAGAPAVDALVAALGNDDAQPLLDAALMRIGRPAVEPLLGRLEEGTRQQRLAAAALLGRLGDRRAVLPLIGHLRSSDSDLVSAAAAALAALGDPRALDDLLPLFAAEHASVRQAAIAAVNSIGAEVTASRIRPLLTGTDPRVREAAIRVAGYFGFESCIDTIVDAVGDEHEEVRRAAIEQLPVLDDVRAVPKLVAALGDETPRNRAAAAHALRAVDDETTVAPLIRALDDPAAWVRYFAASTLGERRLREAIPALVRSARQDSAPHVRIAALQALGEQRALDAFDVAVDMIGERDPDLVSAALAALSALADARADELLDRMLREGDEVFRVPAARALATRGNARAVAAMTWAAHTGTPALHTVVIGGLTRAASASEPEVRDTAVRTLVELATDAALRRSVLQSLTMLPVTAFPALASLLTNGSRAVRLVTVESLARMRHSAASEILAQALGDEDATVRSAAVAALGRLGTHAAQDRIASIAASDPDDAVRRIAGVVCSRNGWVVGKGPS